ncbi:hypothetical protein NDR87_05740 [Nocardia sp. CDC159]|uniref:DUF4232 domain-containing protein n=1 Tax=Nocardia pulmonis TaxID=2951408 RepID=A0A9X2IV39_9NOCA|nr:MULTISPECIES: DUF4232 domain-containing protein [Nocardia]MCM6772838.1 hypothetical protein [Nocardia pulmonis]MCM6785859.1 hypothetical protein [Nocardia sp. CDC159]
MLEPTGPLPPEIYWRRRLLAIAALVVALALLIWLAVFLLRGNGKSADKPAAATSSSAVAKPAGGPGTTASSTAETGTAKPAPTANATASGSPPQCPDQSLALKVTVAQPNYKSGEQPVFRIVITNISTAACSRDVGSGLQQVSVTSLDGQHRLWANTDCDQGGPADMRTLGGGQQAEFTLTWSGTTSQPSCAGERVPVPPGGYAVVAQFGSVRSAPEPFNIA